MANKEKEEPMSFFGKVVVVAILTLFFGGVFYFMDVAENEKIKHNEFCTPIAEKACINKGYMLEKIYCNVNTKRCDVDCIDENQIIVATMEIVCKR